MVRLICSVASDVVYVKKLIAMVIMYKVIFRTEVGNR